ncbi:HEPN domain-containing protein [Nocardia sp. NPDC050712]|uniref:HEPN domain-containing protein n=1 Tax=Nocardia sp. NPDC050712 TaxID=3155518 RepID=UPI00340D5EAA
MDTSDVPLKVLQPPGAYSCRWHLVNNRGDLVVPQPHGTANLLSEQSPSGSISGEVPSPNSGAAWPDVVECKRLAGELSNGAGVLFINAILRIFGQPGEAGISYPDGNAEVRAAMALVGPGADLLENSRIRCIRVQVTGLDRVSGWTPIVAMTMPSRTFEMPESTWSVTTRRDGEQDWENVEMRLRVLHAGSVTVHADYQYGVKFTPYLEIDLREPVEALDAYNTVVQPIVRVLSIITGRKEEVTYLEMRPDGADMPFLQVFARPVRQAPYQPESNKLPNIERALLRCHQDEVSLLEMVDSWQQMTVEQNPIVYTYDPFALGEEQHPRARFLLLLQALEGLSNHENRLSDRQSAHEKKRGVAVSACMKVLTGANRKFIRNKLMASGVTLEDRLRDMFETLPVSPMPYFDNLDIIVQVIRDNSGVTTTISAIQKVRNDLAHGSRTYSDRELLTLAQLLQVIVRVHALRVLGVNDEVQARALNGLLPYIG